MIKWCKGFLGFGENNEKELLCDKEEKEKIVLFS